MISSFQVQSQIKALALGAVAAGALAAVGPAHAQAGFTFNSAEFMPSDARMPAAEAFLAQAAPQGEPMGAAIAKMERAGAFCRSDPGGTVACTNHHLQRPPGDLLQDVEWRVALTPDAQGDVSAASVSRDVDGQ